MLSKDHTALYALGLHAFDFIQYLAKSDYLGESTSVLDD